MPFDKKSAKLAGKKSKLRPVKKDELSVTINLFLKRLQTVISISSVIL